MACLKEEMDFNIKFAKVMLQEQGRLSPMVVGIVDDKRIVFPFIHKNDEEKHELADIIKSKLRELKATALIFMTEAWCVKMHQALVDEKNMPRPSEHPNRQECLVVTYVGNKGSVGTIIPFGRIGDEIIFQEDSISINDHIEDKLWGDTFK